MGDDYKLFKVTDVVKRTGIDKHGEIYEYYEVYFETASGLKSSITVPVNTKKEDIERIVSVEAQKLEDIYHLKK